MVFVLVTVEVMISFPDDGVNIFLEGLITYVVAGLPLGWVAGKVFSGLTFARGERTMFPDGKNRRGEIS